MLAILRRASAATGDSLRRHATAVIVLGFWGIVSIRQFWFLSAADVLAQSGSYGTITTWSFLLVGSVLGLRGLQAVMSRAP